MDIADLPAFFSTCEAFFASYGSFETRFWNSHIEQDLTEMAHFRNDFQQLDGQLNELESVEAPFYNVFEVLNIHHRETKVHTPFLLNLLTPSASHGQGGLFLDTFLRRVMGWDIGYADLSNFSIYEEYSSADQGRIDLLLRFETEGTKKAIVIENKIYAGDQDQQLERYYDFLVTTSGLQEQDIVLVYLKPKRGLPSSLSILPDLRDRLMAQGILVCKGYHEDVIPWLSDCIEDIRSVKVKYTITQYLRTLSVL